MKQIWNWIKDNPNRTMFLIPILLVAAISISHVVTWYDMANPINWAIYLSVAIEVGAITALVAATNKIKGGIWFMFGVVTFIQMVGNIFYSYKEIDASGELFKSWVELTGPIWELMGTETTDIVGMKRWLAFLEGGLLPIISLTSLHFFVKYEKPKEEKEEGREEESSKKTVSSIPPPLSEVFYTNPNKGKKMKDPDTEEWDEDHALDMVMNQMVEDLSDEDLDDTFNEQPNLVEEENPEDEIIEKKEEIKKVTPEELKKDIQLRNGGQELSKTWNNIVKRRKGNKLGE